jgi:predicted MPP superfamily phosphohydrolase
MINATSTGTATCRSSVLPRLRIVALNDVYELTNLPKLQTFLTRVRPDAIILAGDFLSPSTLSSVDGGKGMISTLRSIGLTHCCLGNHEADLTFYRNCTNDYTNWGNQLRLSIRTLRVDHCHRYRSSTVIMTEQFTTHMAV